MIEEFETDFLYEFSTESTKLRIFKGYKVRDRKKEHSITFQTNDANPHKEVPVTERSIEQYFRYFPSLRKLTKFDTILEMGPGLGGFVEFAQSRSDQEILLIDAFKYHEAESLLEAVIKSRISLTDSQLRKIDAVRISIKRITESNQVCLLNIKAEKAFRLIPKRFKKKINTYVDLCGVNMYQTNPGAVEKTINAVLTPEARRFRR